MWGGIVSAFTFNADLLDGDIEKVEACAARKAVAIGYSVACVDSYDDNHFNVRLAQQPGSEASVRDIVAEDEERGGPLYDRLVSTRESIKSCAQLYGRIDISDFDGAAIVKDK